jgi:endoglucanase Acf2
VLDDWSGEWSRGLWRVTAGRNEECASEKKLGFALSRLSFFLV